MMAPVCGQLVIGGFASGTLPGPFAQALREQRLGGAVLFRRNLEGGPADVARLVRAVREAAGDTPFVAIDQEGGRVARLGAPWLQVPSMRTVASWGDVELAQRIAGAVGAELAALGFTVNFAPVLDVNTCPANPVIGDRSFGDTPDVCARFGTAWIRGLQGAGLLACGKHFPGHGDTTKDSHVDLPVVDRPREHLEQIELAPFRAAVAAGVSSIMTAHVVYSAIDARRPATLSSAVCTELRRHIGFHGMLVSDDLEMSAIAAHWSIEEAAVLAIEAGCDALLVCASRDTQERAVDALTREAEASSGFRARCEEALTAVAKARRAVRSRPMDDTAIGRVIGGVESGEVAAEMARRLGH
jgi:beta-N-acetylhexosaminidase